MLHNVKINIDNTLSKFTLNKSSKTFECEPLKGTKSFR